MANRKTSGTLNEINSAMAQEEARKKAKTDKAIANMVKLEDDDLGYVAGGIRMNSKGEDLTPPDCGNAHMSREVCIYDDYCHYAWND